jgi:hypothetical protein
MARPARCLRSVHHLLQPFRSLATGWRLGRIMDALGTAHHASVQMIDSSIVRAHQQGACIIRNRKQSMNDHAAG